jgi:hypothetical protein
VSDDISEQVYRHLITAGRVKVSAFHLPAKRWRFDRVSGPIVAMIFRQPIYYYAAFAMYDHSAIDYTFVAPSALYTKRIYQII